MKRLFWVPAFLFAVCSLAAAPPDSACATHPGIVAPCFSFRGRLSLTNGTPSVRLWRVGTRRVFGLRDEEPPAELRARIKNTDTTELWGDFTVCPFTRSRPGHMQIVCIESWRDVTVRERGE